MYFFPKAVLPWSLRASDSLIWDSVEAIGGGEGLQDPRELAGEAPSRSGGGGAKSLFLNSRGG